jgi:hypothetical protein
MSFTSMKSLLLFLFWTVTLIQSGAQSGFAQSNRGPVDPESVLTYEGAQPPDLETQLALDEFFIFEVHYGFINLGTVEVEWKRDVEWEGESFYQLDMTIKSNPSFPFVGDHRVVYSSLFQVENGQLKDRRFWRDDLHDNEFERVLIEIDREADEVRFFERGEALDTLEIVEPATGGSLIFFFARTFVESTEPYLLQVYTENERFQITASGSEKVDMRSYPAFTKPIPTYLSAGTTNIKGPFGFSGDFKSWFSTDDMRVPLEAEVRIFLGKVKVKLKHYERSASENESIE